MTTGIEQLQIRYEIQLPAIHIGLRVSPGIRDHRDWRYYRGKILRDNVRHTRTVLRRLKHKGWLKDWDGGRMPDYNKDRIRAIMAVVDTADEIEVAGVAAGSMHLEHGTIHESYIQHGKSHSGIRYHASLLFRATVIGADLRTQRVAFLHGDAIFSEYAILENAMRDEAEAA